MSKPLQCYPWYPADWRGSETRLSMTLEERAIYRDLLDHCWVEGSLPNCEKTIKFLASCTTAEWKRAKAKILSKFIEVDGRLYHAKVNERRPEVIALAELRSTKAKEAAKGRWGKKNAPSNAPSINPPMLQAMPKQCLPLTPTLPLVPSVGENDVQEQIGIPAQPSPADQKTKIARQIQAMLADIVGALPDLDACKPAAEEVYRFDLPLPKLRIRIGAIIGRERSADPDWTPRTWGWARTVVAEEARRAGKEHAGELDPDPPSAPRPPRINTISTGGRIVGMSRPGRLKMMDFAIAA